MAQQISHISQKENIHRRAKWIDRFLQKQETKLSQKNLQLLYDYNDDMIICSISETTRYKNLAHFGKLTQMLQKDWADVTEKDLRELVSQLMIKHGENGKETGYTFGLKISIKSIVRFSKLGSRSKPEDGELPMIKFINPKKPKDKLTREDLPTDEEIQKILGACADSTRDKAMLSIHAEAGTRVGELLGLTIKDSILKNGIIDPKAVDDRWQEIKNREFPIKDKKSINTEFEKFVSNQKEILEVIKTSNSDYDVKKDLISSLKQTAYNEFFERVTNSLPALVGNAVRTSLSKDESKYSQKYKDSEQMRAYYELILLMINNEASEYEHILLSMIELELKKQKSTSGSQSPITYNHNITIKDETKQS